MINLAQSRLVSQQYLGYFMLHALTFPAVVYLILPLI